MAASISNGGVCGKQLIEKKTSVNDVKAASIKQRCYKRKQRSSSGGMYACTLAGSVWRKRLASTP